VIVKPENEAEIKGLIKSFGLVFGDIGTSPIYTLTVTILLTKPTEANVIGILSLIVWTLVILVTVAYAWLAMSLGKKGEGGTIVLREILLPLLKSSRKTAFVTLLTFITPIVTWCNQDCLSTQIVARYKIRPHKALQWILFIIIDLQALPTPKIFSSEQIVNRAHEP